VSIEKNSLMILTTKFIVGGDFIVTRFTDVITSLNLDNFNVLRIVKLIYK
jgi:hypothetical protein